jgi:hypothetical protein
VNIHGSLDIVSATTAEGWLFIAGRKAASANKCVSTLTKLPLKTKA